MVRDIHLFSGVGRKFREGRSGHQSEPEQERDRERKAVVGMKLQFGQQVVQRDADEGTGGERQGGGRPCAW
jgi:hypothetical protein